MYFKLNRIKIKKNQPSKEKKNNAKFHQRLNATESKTRDPHFLHGFQVEKYERRMISCNEVWVHFSFFQFWLRVFARAGCANVEGRGGYQVMVGRRWNNIAVTYFFLAAKQNVEISFSRSSKSYKSNKSCMDKQAKPFN